MESMQLIAERRFWVTRAGKESKFFNHFYENGIAAVGHWDKLSLIADRGTTECLDFDSIKQELFSLHGPKNRSAAVKDFNQAFKFINDVKVGDIFVTMTKEAVRIGQVISDPYIERTLLLADEAQLQCDYAIRRRVKWSNSYSRSKLPHAVQRSLRGSQTFFSIDSHKSYINFWMLPFFYDDENAYFSLKINQVEDIANIYVSDLQTSLSKIEAAARYISENEITDEKLRSNIDVLEREFKHYFRELKLSGELVLTTQQEFMSPGVIWAKVAILNKKQLSAIMLIFSSALLADPTLAGDTDLSTNQINMALVLAEHIAEDNFIDQAKEKLKIEPPNTSLVFKNKIVKIPMDEIFPDVVSSTKTPI